MEKNEYQIQHENLNLIKMNIYDELFPQRIRANASTINIRNNLENFREIDNHIYETVVHGTYDYKVRVQLSDNLLLKNCSCECAYFVNTDHHCKHVYALLTKIIQEKNNLIIQKKYDENILKLEKNVNRLSKIIEKNKDKVNDAYLGNWINAIFEKNNRDLRDSKRIIISGMSERDSYYILNHSLSILNDSISDINEVEKSLSNYYIKDSKENNVTTKTYTFDDSIIFDALNEKIAEIPLEVLKKAREESIKNGESTEIIDKAIKEKMRCD